MGREGGRDGDDRAIGCTAHVKTRTKLTEDRDAQGSDKNSDSFWEGLLDSTE